MEDINVCDATISDVENIVTELCSNVVRHSGAAATKYAVTMEFYGQRLVITVVDKGKGFAKEDMPSAGTIRSDGNGGARVGGYGIPLLEGLADKIDFSVSFPHGATVRVEKVLDYKTQKDAANAIEEDKATGAITLKAA
jgi:anti-sigma regulatory factor (Ser/Thr protein kinase)